MAPTNRALGVLLTNVGTPDEPTPKAVRRYLKQFLSDRRVVDYPRWLWLPILHGVILNTRPRRSARLYQNVWSERGSPLLYTSLEIARKLEESLKHTHSRPVVVRAGMRYGQPAIGGQLKSLVQAGAEDVLILPLFPQYSATTTGASYDAVFEELGSWKSQPSLITVDHYFDHHGYIEAVAGSIQASWAAHRKSEKLLFSFHGIPKRFAEKEPYVEQCRASAQLVADRLGLGEGEWLAAFQSRFGPEEWVRPYTDETLEEWGSQGVESVSVVAPGFAADCLETVDELGREAREIFLVAGGGEFRYVPALNDRDAHVEALAKIVAAHTETGAGLTT